MQEFNFTDESEKTTLDPDVYIMFQQAERIPHFRDCFTTKISNPPTKILLRCQRWFLDFAYNRFIDAKFQSDWLSYTSISKNDFEAFYAPNKASQLYLDALADFCDTYRTDSPISDLDLFMYNPNTFKSFFLRHAKKIVVKQRSTLLQTLVKSYAKKIDREEAYTGYSYWEKVEKLASWYEENIQNIKTVNHNTWLFSPVDTLEKFLNFYIEFTVTNSEFRPSDLTVGNRNWWAFSEQIKRDYQIKMNPTSREIEDSPAITGEPPVVIGLRKPPKYYTDMDWKQQFFYDLQTDTVFQERIKKTNIALWRVWESSKFDVEVTKKYMESVQ